MENEQLSMAPTDFMQVHRTDFPQKRFNTQRDKTVEDANKRLNMQRGIYFTSSGMHKRTLLAVDQTASVREMRRVSGDQCNMVNDQPSATSRQSCPPGPIDRI
ncbi:hypothetical protein ACMD2_26456, partial [Ananas comosus]